MPKGRPKFLLSRSASLDIDEIWDHIAADSLDAADRVVDELERVFLLLADHRFIGRNRDDIEVGIHCHPHSNYNIFYFPRETGVEIYRVLHSARKVTQIFDKAIDLPDEET